MRNQPATKYKHIGLDVDGVVSDFSTGIIRLANKRGLGHLFPSCADEVSSWDMCKNPKDFLDLFLPESVKPEFWLSLPPITESQKFFANGNSFVPELYITKRAVPSEVTARWLKENGFPEAEVITVGDPAHKAEIVKARCDVYVDDLIETVAGMRAQGINALLFQAPYQRGHDTLGLPSIKSLAELVEHANANRR